MFSFKSPFGNISMDYINKSRPWWWVTPYQTSGKHSLERVENVKYNSRSDTFK